MTRPAYKAALLALSVVLLSHCAPAPRPPATEVGSRQIERTMMDDIVDRMQIREATERQRKADELVSRLEYYKAYKVYDEGGKPFENDRNLLYRKYKSLIDAQKMVDEHRQSALANYQLGKAYYDYTAEPDGASRRVALMERAREHLARAIRLDSNQEQAFLLLARVMEEQGKSEQFQPYLPKLEKIENKSDMTLLFLGAEYVRKGDHQRAEDYLNRIPDGSPQCIQAMYYQGLIDAEKGLWLEALVNFSRARNLNPEAERKFKEALDRVRGSSNTLRSQ
jgi:tetratricopeptide (TPR) repeat protein